MCLRIIKKSLLVRVEGIWKRIKGRNEYLIIIDIIFGELNHTTSNESKYFDGIEQTLFKLVNTKLEASKSNIRINP